MILVPFDPAKLKEPEKTKFENWRATADVAQLALIAQPSEKRKFNSKLWGWLKVFLLDHVFHGKCAYCEVKITAGFVGDAEHYRPKGAVAEAPGHPGYYWLCYEWHNLLPSCTRCNTIRGKRTQFPVAKKWQDTPSKLTLRDLNRLEGALLLHPYDEDEPPEQHLDFLPDGWVMPRTDRGKASIEVFDLNREGLRDARRMARMNAIYAFQLNFAAILKDYIDNRARLKEGIDELEKKIACPSVEFSAMTKATIRDIRACMGS